MLSSAIQQHESATGVYIYVCVPSLLHPPAISHSTSTLLVVTEHWAELPVSHSEFPLAIYFICGNVYVCVSSSVVSNAL